MLDENIIKYLEKMNFTKLESQIYLTLLDNGEMSAYQIAKKIEISRSSIYNALNHMYEKGIVNLIPDSASIYIAENPEVLFTKLSDEYKNNSKILIEQLKSFSDSRCEERLVNFKGFDNVVSKVKKLLNETKSDVYINTDLDLKIFSKEFEDLKKRGIIPVVFSFYDLDAKGIWIKLYTHKRKKQFEKQASRFMMVVDEKVVIIADYYKDRNMWFGSITNNKLMISIVAEHIHNDIYLLNLRNKYGKEIYDNEVFINSDFENRMRGK